ncbi:NAD(P)/FAD-dependent oxidoreductase [Amycolatopsis sp. cg5]|uniref:NAD(P)/FAD-dependent oxidoreductase n=1 Tax=Amycolatopsis sp. cg5 TaxID=3238802 RepID=UPI0035236E38
MNRKEDRESRRGGHALVIGAGIAGLLTARVLADHYRTVTIVERDGEGTTRAFRSGVPQARHPHLALGRSRQIIEELFPDIHAELGEYNSPVFDFGLHTRIVFADGIAPRAKSGIPSQGLSRPLLDAALQAKVLALPNVGYQAGCRVVGLLYDKPTRTVTGVKILERTQKSDGVTAEVRAELVVDASGRSSHLPDWLKNAGLPETKVSTVNPRLGYATRLFDVPKDVDFDWKVLGHMTAAPHVSRGCLGLRIEDDQVLIAMQGTGGDYPQGDEAGYREFAASLQDGIGNLISRLTPRSPVYVYRDTVNTRRAYHRLPWPKGLVAIGDTVCSFNPLYGQGITVAAEGALVLRQLLTKAKGNPTDSLRGFQRRLARMTMLPWMMSTASDRGWQEGGESSWGLRMQQKVMDAWIRTIPGDEEMYLCFIKIMHMVAKPTVLMRPRLIARIARAAMSPPKQSSLPTPSAHPQHAK